MKFDGKRFYNLEPSKRKGSGLANFLKWSLTRNPTKWPKWVDIPNAEKPVERVYGNELLVTFVNHATVLIQTQGLNILTDPVWSKRVGPMNLLGPKRVKHPGIMLDDLPPIDVILLSHDHYDHLDVLSLVRLQRKFHSKIYAGLKINKILHKAHKNLSAFEMAWWEEVKFNDDIKIHFLPAKHWSGRKGFYDLNMSLWGSFAIETPGGNIYFAGDTGYCKHFEEIGRKFGKFRLSLLPIGAYEARWFMREFHINPEEAVIAHKELNSERSMAIHFGTFCLSDEGYDQPVQDLAVALAKHNMAPESFKAMVEGESWCLV